MHFNGKAMCAEVRPYIYATILLYIIPFTVNVVMYENCQKHEGDRLVKCYDLCFFCDVDLVSLYNCG